MRRREGDDYAARLYLIFDKPASELPWRQRLQYRVARLLYGPLPSRALSYIWANHAGPGEIHPSPYTGFARLVVVRSGPEQTGRWLHEERDLYDDYMRAFGEEPPPLAGVAIMTDSDDTQGSARAWYGDIWLERAGTAPPPPLSPGAGR